MWSWLNRKRDPDPPGVSRETLGRVSCHSGTLLVGDPTSLCDAVRVEGIPPGRVPVVVELIRYPEGGSRVAMVRLHIWDGEPDSRQTLGESGVDSGKVVVVDARTQEECWKEVGPDRVGIACSPKHREVAELIARRFGLRHRQLNFIRSEFLEPITDEREAEITGYLQTFPEYAAFPFMFFRVHTNNTVDRIWAAMEDRVWAEVAIGTRPDENLIAVTSGFGDGHYTVEGLCRGGELLALEVRFIGPDQEPLLEAFPALRH